MPTPTGWNSTTEYLCGVNDPDGRADTANKYARTLWQNLCTEHNSDGTHQTAAVVFATGSYQSQPGAQTISIQLVAAQITFVQITARGLYNPVMATTAMPAGGSKVLSSLTLQPNCITDLTTPGEFTVGTHATVNSQTETITYDYCVYAVVSQEAL